MLAYPAAKREQAKQFFSNKLGYETDCSDVYTDIKSGHNNFILLDVRSNEVFYKSHAITALSMPNNEINETVLSKYSKEIVFIVYCWGPGCNGATKAAMKISTLGFAVKEMISGIHYWKDFERYPVNCRMDET